MRVHRIPVLVLLLAVGLLVSSCIEVKVESDFEEDGSARHVFEFTMERQALEELGEMGEEALDIQDDFSESQREAENAGYEAELIDTDELLGMRISKTVEDNSDLGQVINDLYSVGAEGEGATTAFSGSYTSDGDTHTLTLTVDGTSLMGEEVSDSEMEIPPAMMSNFLDMSYTVRMPGELVEDETNGRILPDGRVTWDLPLSGTATFTAVSRTESSAASVLMWVVLGGLLLLFIGGAAGLVVFLLMRARKAPAAAPAGAPPPPYRVDPEAPTSQLPPSNQVTGSPPAEDS